MYIVPNFGYHDTHRCVCACVCVCTYIDFPFRPVVVRTVYELDIIVVETEGTEYREVEAEDITQHRQ